MNYTKLTLFLLGFLIIIVGICTIVSLTTPVLSPVDFLTPDSLKREHVIDVWQETANTHSINLHYQANEDTPLLALVISEIDSFTLTQNKHVIYQYDREKKSQRTHVIYLEKADIYNLNISADQVFLKKNNNFLNPLTLRTSLLLCTAEKATLSSRTADVVTGGIVGLYSLIIIYSLSLYVKKRSETYLLMMSGLGIIALLSTFSNSNITLLNIRPIADQIRYIRVMACAILPFHLMHINLPGKWHRLIEVPEAFLIMLGLIILDGIGLKIVADILCNLTVIPSLIVCILGVAKGISGAYVLSVGTAIREGIRIYVQFMLRIPLIQPIMFHYYYAPQINSVFFILACVVVVNLRFADKFSDADRFNIELAGINQQLDQKVNERTEQLHNANTQILMEQKKKQNLMFNIFHDLRTPIFAAQGLTELIEPANSVSEKNLSLLTERIDFLNHMAQELLDLARLEDVNNPLESFRLRSEVFCYSIAEAAQVMASKKGVSFISEIKPNLFFPGDSYKLKKALDNILMNAVKYTPPSGKIIFRVFSEKEYICFEVADNGQGISTEELPHIFERYYYSSYARRSDSLGLGLTIAHAIVNKHGGNIRVESLLGIGSTFTIALPLEDYGKDPSKTL